MKIKNLIGRKLSDLTPIEQEFFENSDQINICDHTNIIDYSSELYWNDEHDLKGYDALCHEAYIELDCRPLED